MSVPAAAAPLRGGLMPLAVGWAAVLLWGGSPIATRLAVVGLDPLAVGILRTVLAAAIALPLALVLRLKQPRDGRGWASCSRRRRAAMCCFRSCSRSA
jgi:drug/metabolite transporter (DMT)-like permease